MSAHNELISVKADLPGKLRAQPGRSQNERVVRFGIITMMPVLVGLSTLKLR